MPYISFCGFLLEPEIDQQVVLNNEHPYKSYPYNPLDGHYEVTTNFRVGLHYEPIGGQDSLTVFLAKTDIPGVGHLVADCPQGGWANDCWVKLDEADNPLKQEDNWNPNPVPQVI
jgi:hypothetical protein